MSPELSCNWAGSEKAYAPSISRLDNTRSIRGRMPSSLEMARDSSNRDMAFSRSPEPLRWSRVSPMPGQQQCPNKTTTDDSFGRPDVGGFTAGPTPYQGVGSCS